MLVHTLPEVPSPPKAMFRKWMHAFGTNAPVCQPDHYSMELEKSLDTWLLVEGNWWFECYKSKWDCIMVGRGEANNI